MKESRKQATRRRHARIRRKVSGTSDCPRLAVFRSNQHIYVQLIDDETHSTIAAASSVEKDLKVEAGNTCEASVKIGAAIAKRAIAKGIKSVVFDRGGNLYHGRVKALADAAREGGLEF
jgi:large subunit ribosomal protein L18